MTDTIDAPPPYTASPGRDDLRTWPPPPCYLYANPPEHNRAPGGVSEVDRLRNFLLHALSYDYGCSRLAGLSRRDRDHFSNLLKRLDAGPTYDPQVDTYLTLRERGDYLNRHIYDPCNALHITEDSVTAIIRNFFEFQGVAKEPGALAFFKKDGGHTLAHKVYCNQFLVIPRLTPHEHIRAQLRRSGHLVVDPYLARICGPPSQREVGVCKLRDVSYVLTIKGAWCEAARVNGSMVVSAVSSISSWATRARDYATSFFRGGKQSEHTEQMAQPYPDGTGASSPHRIVQGDVYERRRAPAHLIYERPPKDAKYESLKS
ncbi:hypothetical protein LTR53_005261 [Teratosphaeriaceae sp. CCFEE 6253]|nr:hypothetical protein LTR53_005261 [Teratosphaeriaceae sp. CCFEE 6253]